MDQQRLAAGEVEDFRDCLLADRLGFLVGQELVREHLDAFGVPMCRAIGKTEPLESGCVAPRLVDGKAVVGHDKAQLVAVTMVANNGKGLGTLTGYRVWELGQMAEDQCEAVWNR
jgi:hypothetical protein